MRILLNVDESSFSHTQRTATWECQLLFYKRLDSEVECSPGTNHFLRSFKYLFLASIWKPSESSIQLLEIQKLKSKFGYTIFDRNITVNSVLRPNSPAAFLAGFPAPFSPWPRDSRTYDTAGSSRNTAHTDLDRPGFSSSTPSTECSPPGTDSVLDRLSDESVADVSASLHRTSSNLPN